MKAKFKYKDAVNIGGDSFFRGELAILSDFDYSEKTGRWGYIGHLYPTGKPVSDLQEDDLTLTDFPKFEKEETKEELQSDLAENENAIDILLASEDIPGGSL